MWNEPGNEDSARQHLSALMDGELGGQAADQGCAHWRETADSRAAWHAYHLIGDVLRSDDLACHPSRDIGFLVALRARLDQEPVVLAPGPVQAASQAIDPRTASRSGVADPAPRRRRAWGAPTAVAAGFLAVAGVLTVTRPGVTPGSVPASQSIAGAEDATSGAKSLPGRVDVATVGPARRAQPTAEPLGFVATGQVIRDARLDRYLAAHQQFAGSSALGVPSAYLRHAAVDVPGR